MEPAKLRQQILLSNKTASEKAEHLLLKREVNEMSKDEWRELIAGIPDDLEREIGRLKSAGTQLHLHVCLIVQGHQLALQHHLVSQWRCLILQLVAWQAHCIFWCIAAGPFANMDTTMLTGLNIRMLSAVKRAQQQVLGSTHQDLFLCISFVA